MTSGRCIWCLQATAARDEEHIFPEAIGCPEGFVLPGTVVCRPCNNGLAHLDQAVADDFDFLTFTAGVRGKKGRPAKVKSRGNVAATVEAGVPTYSFNIGKSRATAHDGSDLAPFRGSPRDVLVNLSHHGAAATASFAVPFGTNPKFTRGLTKIALSTLAYFLGAELAYSSQFEAVRNFVRLGIGRRHALLRAAGDTSFRNVAWPPYVSASGASYSVAFRIVCVEFLIDLTDGETELPALESKMVEHFGASGWCKLPRE